MDRKEPHDFPVFYVGSVRQDHQGCLAADGKNSRKQMWEEG